MGFVAALLAHWQLRGAEVRHLRRMQGSRQEWKNREAIECSSPKWFGVNDFGLEFIMNSWLDFCLNSCFLLSLCCYLLLSLASSSLLLTSLSLLSLSSPLSLSSLSHLSSLSSFSLIAVPRTCLRLSGTYGLEPGRECLLSLSSLLFNASNSTLLISLAFFTTVGK